MGTHPIFESDFDCLTEMGNLLGGKNKSRVTDLDRAVLGLKKQRDELKRAQKRIENEEDQIKLTKEQHAVVQALDKGNSALKELHKIMDPEAVQRIMDDMEDEVAMQSEIDDLISKSITSVDE